MTNMPNIALCGALIQQLSIAQQHTASLLNRVLLAHQINFSQLSILSHFARQPEQALPLTTLADDMNLNQPATTKIVQHLTQAGWLAYGQDKLDARKRLLSITTDGLAHLTTVYEAMAPTVATLFEGYSEEEINTFLALLARLNTQLQRLR